VIPLAFRPDVLSASEHQLLFSSIEQVGECDGFGEGGGLYLELDVGPTGKSRL